MVSILGTRCSRERRGSSRGHSWSYPLGDPRVSSTSSCPSTLGTRCSREHQGTSRGHSGSGLEPRNVRRVSSTPSYQCYPRSEHASPGSTKVHPVGTAVRSPQRDSPVSSIPSWPRSGTTPRRAVVQAVQQQSQSLRVWLDPVTHTEFTPPELCTHVKVLLSPGSYR